jgi:hypothetical protein
LIGHLIKIQVSVGAQLVMLHFDDMIRQQDYQPVNAVKIQVYKIRVAFVLFLWPQANKNNTDDLQRNLRHRKDDRILNSVGILNAGKA